MGRVGSARSAATRFMVTLLLTSICFWQFVLFWLAIANVGVIGDVETAWPVTSTPTQNNSNRLGHNAATVLTAKRSPGTKSSPDNEVDGDLEKSFLFPPVWKAIVEAGRNSDSFNLSAGCSAALREYSAALGNREPWAVGIYDSSGKLGPGMLIGGMTQHGNYDECLNTRHFRQLEPPRDKALRGTQFCSAFFSTPTWVVEFADSLNVPFPPKLSRVTVDLCVPSTCTTLDVVDVLSKYMSGTNDNVTLEEVDCFQAPSFADDTAAIVLVSVLCFILLCVVIGTCLDVMHRLNMAEIVRGEETHVGYREQPNRLSRFRNSLLSHWHNLGGGDYKPIQRRRNTIAYKPSVMRRLSQSIIRRRPSLVDDVEETIGRASSDREVHVTARQAKNRGQLRNSFHDIPSGDCNRIQLTIIQSTNVDRNENSVHRNDASRQASEQLQQATDGQQSPTTSELSTDVFSDAKGSSDVGSAAEDSPRVTSQSQSSSSSSSSSTVRRTVSVGKEDDSCDDMDTDTMASLNEDNNSLGKEGDSLSCTCCQSCGRNLEHTSNGHGSQQQQGPQRLDRLQGETSSLDEDATSSITSLTRQDGELDTDLNTHSFGADFQGSKDDSSSTCGSNIGVTADGSCRRESLIPSPPKHAHTCVRRRNSDSDIFTSRETTRIVLQGGQTSSIMALERTERCDRGPPDEDRPGNNEHADQDERRADNRDKHAESTSGSSAAGRGDVEDTRGEYEDNDKGDDGDDDDEDGNKDKTDDDDTAGGENSSPANTGPTNNNGVTPDNSEREARPTTLPENLCLDCRTLKGSKAVDSAGRQTRLAEDGHAASTQTVIRSLSSPAETTGSSRQRNLDSPDLEPEALSITGRDTFDPKWRYSERDIPCSPTKREPSWQCSATGIPSSPTKSSPNICFPETDVPPRRYRKVHYSGGPLSPTKHSAKSRSFGGIDSAPIVSPSKQRLWKHRFQEPEAPSSPTPTIHSSLSHSLTSIREETQEEVRKSVADGEDPPTEGTSAANLNGRAVSLTHTDDNTAATAHTDSKTDDSDVSVRYRRKWEKKGGEEGVTKVELGRQPGAAHHVEGGTPAASEPRRGLLVESLLCFSFLRSVRRALAEGNPDHLFSLNGVRVLSISWIVLGNTLSLLHGTPSLLANNVDTVTMASSVWFQALMNGTFAADTFFVLSGCLVTYHFLRSKSKELKSNPEASLLSLKSILLFYVHRIMRIVPCYYVVLLSYTVLMPYFGNSPMWKESSRGTKRCQDHWWANALFFSNFYKPHEMCMTWSYYLVNDFQFYLVSPLFLYPLLYLPVLGLSLLVALVVIQIVSTALLTNDINGNMLSMETEFFVQVYSKPYCRIGAFAVGMGLGFFLHSTERRVFFRKVPLLVGWLTSLTVVGTVVYVTHTEYGQSGEPWSAVQTSLYEALSRPLWCLAVAFIMFVCTVGQGGFVYRLLSWNAFLPLCRITYGVYLLHPILISVELNNSRYPFHLHFGSLVYKFVANLVCSYGLALFLITLVECPFTSLENVIRKRFS